jgi:hypothetical protein
MFQFFLSTPLAGGWPETLTSLFSAGAPLPATTVRAFHDRFGLKIHSFYGASEAGGITIDDGDEIDDSGTVGRPLPGVTVTLRMRRAPTGAFTSPARGGKRYRHGNDEASMAASTGDCGLGRAGTADAGRARRLSTSPATRFGPTKGSGAEDHAGRRGCGWSA